MAKKCPPGVICFENMTLILIVLILGYIIYTFVPFPIKTNTIIHQPIAVRTNMLPNLGNDNISLHQIPITVNTQRMENVYKQIGILTRLNHKEVILPLYGRMVNTSRVKWQYYTMNDSNNNVRLPISINGKSGSDEYGVDELYNGDTIYVEGYEDVFKVTIYENNRYTYNSL